MESITGQFVILPKEDYVEIKNMIKEIKELVNMAEEQPVAAGGSDFPADGTVTLLQIMKFLGIPKSSWWMGVKDGRYPKPLLEFKRPCRWSARDIRKLARSSV